MSKITPSESPEKGLSLAWKLIVPTVLILVLVVGVTYVIFMRGYARDMRDAMLHKASGFTAVADEAKNHASMMISNDMINTEAMQVEAQETIAAGGNYRETRLFDAIPVVVGWKSAKAAADREHIDFEIIAYNARNKDNEPSPESFEGKLLQKLEEQVDLGGEEWVSAINKSTNSVHYMRAIRLDQSCMHCHGDPAVYDERDEQGTFDGRDVLGFEMEHWEVGDMHGAYAVTMPLAAMDHQIAGFIKSGLMITVPLVILGCAGFVMLIRLMLLEPLRKLIALVKDIATGDGDLTKRLALTKRDEIGHLGHWFDVFVSKLHGIISEVRSATMSVASSSGEIAASAEQMAAGLKSQEQQSNQVAAAVEQMSASVSEVAQMSSDASSAAEQSQAAAREGGDVVGSTVAEMRGIAGDVQVSAEAVRTLGRKSDEIGEIISVIDDIADQTNLLALNAAIEAARAGENGRGFAVVADEVRKLAERTQQATEQVAAGIREIQNETTNAVSKIEAGSERVSKGVDLASSAGTSLNRIVEHSQHLQQMVAGIAAAAEQQSAASTEISTSVDGINAVTRESAEGASQAAQASSDLAVQSDRLRALVERFKLD